MWVLVAQVVLLEQTGQLLVFMELELLQFLLLAVVKAQITQHQRQTGLVVVQVAVVDGVQELVVLERQTKVMLVAMVMQDLVLLFRLAVEVGQVRLVK
jgi:hypothetical protein